MSQSPLSQTKDVNDDYLESFAKLAQRIRSGNSFSGNERNCAFMNSRDGTFTDASYSLGLDLILAPSLFVSIRLHHLPN